MYYLMGVVGLALVAAGLFGGTLFGRYYGARALGIRGLRWLERDAADEYFAAPRARRLLAHIGGPLAAYVFVVLPFFVALYFGGTSEATTEIEPIEGSPASEAGVRDGDRVVAIDGRPIARWDEVSDKIRHARNAVVELRLERAGKSLDVRVTRTPAGTIGIAPRMRDTDVPLGEALRVSAVRPLAVMYQYVDALIGAATGREKANVVGPVGIVKAAEQSARNRWREFLMLLGLLGSYCWPGSILLELFMTPRRVPKRDVPAPP